MELADERPTCPSCGQALPPGNQACANCGRDEANPYAAPAPPVEPPLAAVESRILPILVVAGVATMAIGYFVPGIGVGLSLVLIPAAIRAAAAVNRQPAKTVNDRRIGYGQALAVSVGVMFLVWLASSIAFGIVCFPFAAVAVTLGERGIAVLVVGAVSGLAAGIVVFVWLTRRYWPPEKNDDATA